MDFSNVKVIVSEMDGIITEHLAGMGEFNVTMFKQYYMKDFEVVNILRKHFGFSFLSSDPSINLSLCRKRNIPFYWAEKGKLSQINGILRRFNVSPDDLLYVGCTYSDIEVMSLAGLSICPEDSVVQVKNKADRVLPVYGGAGVLCQLYDLLYDEIEKRKRENN
jgi:3-deoxy-D-manno-octulosonate 8-phosphate phosphatase (KDO 8-P phosphatase)